MAHPVDLRAEVLAKYPEVMRNMSAEDGAAALDLLQASAAHWGDQMWIIFQVLLEHGVEETAYGPMLPEIANLCAVLQMYLAGVGNRTRPSRAVMEQLQRFSEDNLRAFVNVAAFVAAIASAYLRRKFIDAPVDAPGAEHEMEVCVGFSKRFLTMRWQPLTGMSYSRACLLLCGMFCVRRMCARLRIQLGNIEAVDWELVPPQHAPPLQFLPVPPNPDWYEDISVDRTVDMWMLDFPVPENIPRALARMHVIHRILPVQTAQCRRVLAAACQRVLWESQSYDYMRAYPMSTWQTQWPEELAVPHAHPWSCADALEDEGRPWCWAFHKTVQTSYIPINSDDGQHKWLPVCHARILLAERELLRRYIEVAEVAVGMGAYAQSQHLRLGDRRPASTMPPDMLHCVHEMLRPRFRSFQDDILGMLTRGDDEAWL